MDKIKQIRERLKNNPNDAQAHWQYGCALAFSGDWEEAWNELEWRFRGHRLSMHKRSKYPKPTWDGEQTRLLIYQDQGFGDLFQYVRYVHEIKCPYVLNVNASAYRLLKDQGFNVNIQGMEVPEYDQVVAVCSLPYYFRHFSAKQGYLVSGGNNFLLEGGKKKIGIAWAGNPDYYDDGHRSCDPKEFLALADCGELISLMIQKVDIPFTDFSLKIKDFADTAEIISQLDCVVTVDTAVGHLAAALGKPVYLALSYEHDWRWMSGETTPWYSTMRLFRQPKKDDWQSVFGAIYHEILH